MAYYDALDAFDNLVQTFGLDPLAGTQLRGVGLDADAFVEELLWNEPVSFSKSLEMTLRRTRWSVERFDVLNDKYLRLPVIMSAQVFPSTRDKLLFTDTGGGSFTPRVRIAGIVGGTYAGPGDTEGTTTACVFGISAALAHVDLTAEGLGGCADRSLEYSLWGDPIDFSKSLRMAASRQRLSVERFNAITDRFDRFPARMSVQFFPQVNDELFVFNPPIITPKLTIQGIIGASYRVPEESDARTAACLHGFGPPSTLINFTADGLGGPFNTSASSDGSGRWEACLGNLKQGYYMFTADDGTSTDVKEQGFYLAPLTFKF